MKQPKIILGLILFLALFSRTVFLGSLPAGFSPDEASQAYTAYSLLQTGHDEWGLSWPISSFKSFLDYKAPLQTYLMMPGIALFGLGEFSARLPSALFGTLAVLTIYFLSKKLFKSESLSLIAAFFLAISPWHLQFSRTALEVNLASFLFPLGLYFFLCFLHPDPEEDRFSLSTSLIFTAISWSLCLYTYHAAKIFLPLFVLTIVFQQRRLLLKNIKVIIPSLIIGVLIISPLVWGTLFGQAGKRGADLVVTSLSEEQQKSLNDETFYSQLNKISPKLSRVFHNRFVFSLSKFAENYVSYYTPSFWFTEGGREITYSVIPGRGLLYFWMLPLIAWAVFDLLKDKKKRSVLIILIPWLLLAALPAALTKEGYRPNRAGSFAVVWEMLAAYGAFGLFTLRFPFKKIISIFFIGFSLIITLFYFEDYVFGSAVNYPTAISYGWREAVGYLQTLEPRYDSILIEQGSQPQSFVAFYTRYNPRDFQQFSAVWNRQIAENNQSLNYLDQLGRYQLGKYHFEALNWPEDINQHTLYLSRPNALLPSQRRVLHRVEASGKVIFEIFDFKK